MVTLVIERIRKAYETHTHTKSLGLFTFVCRASWGAVKIKPHHPAIRNQWNQWQTAGEEQQQLSAACLLCGFCLRLSSLGNTQSKAERQMSAKSHRSNTLRSLFMRNQDRSCSSTGADWLEQEVSDCISIVSHTHTQTGQWWRRTRSRGLWSLCVYTEEQYVVISRSWRGVPNPLLFNRIVHLII